VTTQRLNSNSLDHTAMNIDHLRKKGWSQKEVSHLQAFMDKKETRIHDHIALWVLLLLLLLGAVGAAFGILPILLFLPAIVGTPFVLLLGVCYGLLLVHALRSLAIHSKHHVTGVSLLVIGILAVMTITLGSLSLRFQITPLQQNPILIGVVFIIGLLLPYLLERRLHGSS